MIWAYVSDTIVPNILAEVNKEVKLAAVRHAEVKVRLVSLLHTHRE